MNDEDIIRLYFDRDETAITETSAKYGKYCYSIANNILHNHEDSEECVSDTYQKTWESIPPQKPNIFSAFLGRITRNLSINRYKLNTAFFYYFSVFSALEISGFMVSFGISF